MPTPQRNKVIAAISAVSIAIGIIVMAGWLFNIPILKEIVPGFVPMVFNPALCFVLFGTALLVKQYLNLSSRYRGIVFLALSTAGALVGLITLLQFLFHFNTGLDELFVTDSQKISANHLYAGRMAYNTAIAFTLLGLGFLMLSLKRRVLNLIAQYLFHTVSVLSAIALIGYLYGVSLFNTLLYVSSMATHTAILFLILSVGAAMLNPS
ncbi:MAG TPA: hypothetical protein VJ844_06275, partial [Mucilaginibacter sp.]|nr:hypothetical protein [Mucilaginibacter sp.]